MKKQIPVRIDIELYEEVKKKLKEVDRSFNNYITQLIKEDLRKGK